MNELSVRLELFAVNDGWRWTLTDSVGTTQGWEPSYGAATQQARHVMLVHSDAAESEMEDNA